MLRRTDGNYFLRASVDFNPISPDLLLLTPDGELTTLVGMPQIGAQLYMDRQDRLYSVDPASGGGGAIHALH